MRIGAKTSQFVRHALSARSGSAPQEDVNIPNISGVSWEVVRLTKNQKTSKMSRHSQGISVIP